jgi:hypothetical protein
LHIRDFHDEILVFVFITENSYFCPFYDEKAIEFEFLESIFTMKKTIKCEVLASIFMMKNHRFVYFYDKKAKNVKF